MKPPKSVRILGKKHRIRFVRPSPLRCSDVGAIEHSRSEISVLGTMSRDELRETTLHECVHVIDHQLGLGLTEQQVTALSSGLFAVARENPRVVRWMLGL